MSCGAAVSRPFRARGEPWPESWHYEVWFDEELRDAQVKLCFEGPAARELRAGKDGDAALLRHARWLSPGSVETLAVVDGRIQVAHEEEDGCLEYSVALVDQGTLDSPIRHVGSDVVASPNVWLWRPNRRSAQSRATVRINLPKGMRASLPWPRQGDHYVLDASAFRFDSYAAFGRFRAIDVHHAGVHLEAVVLNAPFALDDEGVERWLMRAIDVSSMLDGRFPTERAQIIIIPAGPSSDPVQFGAVARGGSGSVMLFASSEATQQALESDWVLPHELSHLYLPFVMREDAWLPEGLATYYQEVLRARAGVLEERVILQDVVRAMASASRQGTGRSLREESAAMHHTYAFRAVYWAGAAFWLLADVALREQSRGERSLDWILTRLRGSPPRKSVLSADELLAHMDALAGGQTLTKLAAAVLGQPFPEYLPTLARLGIQVNGSQVTLDDRAELAALRRAIFDKRDPASTKLESNARSSRD
jgi:hypothetical protein